MCLKYFVGYSSCDHHEYLGSHHCSLRPCALDTQHFHYIEDGFPVPWPADNQPERGLSACNICASGLCGKLDPDEAPVQPYAPTNDFQVKEIQLTGYTLPIQVVRAEQEETTAEETESQDSGDVSDYDYKSLSDADDDEWDLQRNTYHSTAYDKAHYEELAQRHHDYLQSQLSYLPDYLMQQRQSSSFVPLGLTTGNYFHHPMPHMMYLAPPPVLPMAPWHGGMAPQSSAPSQTPPSRPDDFSPQFLPVLIAEDANRQSRAAPLPQRPVTPPPTPPMDYVPPPFIVGSITDAYLRIEAVKRKHMHERARRQRSSLRDALPTRNMALTNFMVKKRTKRGHRKDVDALEDIGVDLWSSLPFADEESDTKCGAQGDTGIPLFGSETETSQSSC